VLHGYACWSHPFDAYFQSEAQILSNQAGYGAIRAPSADGEHYEWQLGPRGAFAFLMETHTTFQPAFSSAVAEAQQVWPATLWMLQRAIPLQGHVTDAVTGDPVEAEIAFQGIVFANGEANFSDPATGRYAAFVPGGTYDVVASAPGYVTQIVAGVTVIAGAGTVQDIALQPDATGVAVTERPAGTRLLYVDPLRLALGYELDRPSAVDLRIYDVRGALVRGLLHRVEAPGRHDVTWNGRSDGGAIAPAGVYLFRLQTGRNVHAGKLVRIR
jgi:hypothetical protein